MWVANRVSAQSLAFILNWTQPLQVNQESISLVPLFGPPTPVVTLILSIWSLEPIYDCLMIDTLDYTLLNVCIFQCAGSVSRNHWQHCMTFCFVLFCLLINLWEEVEFPSFNYPFGIPLSLHNSNWRGSVQLYYQIRKMKGLQSG